MTPHRLTQLAVALLIAGSVIPAAAQNTGWKIIAWNDLGMHCMDADFSVFSLLPPYNTIHAQVIDPTGRLVRTAGTVVVTYEAVADPQGSVNTTSRDKTNFWQHVPSLFGASPAIDSGLTGSRMPGANNQPQPMTFDPARAWFTAEGIPLTPYDDAGNRNPYPMMKVSARDASGAVLASTSIVLPVSDEMACNACHGPAPLDPSMPASEVDRRTRIAILQLHDSRTGGDMVYRASLAAAGYNPAGLYATAVTDGKAVLCAKCHLSNALAGSGLPDVISLTRAIHGLHATVTDPVTSQPLDSTTNRTACYRCHPGSETKCLRGVMGASVAADGTLAIQCQDCHGSMAVVGDPSRNGWLNEPLCQSCHTGTAVANAGALRFTSVFTATGDVRQAVSPVFASSADAPAAGLSLYRFSAGHGSLQCEACHGSTHAVFPTTHENDNVASRDRQGFPGVVAQCESCHGSVPRTANGGPHGLHPIGQSWVGSHGDTAEHNSSACQACHGGDLRGTVLSRARADRSLNTEFGAKPIWRGFQIGCYMCHNGPQSESRNPNRPPSATDATATTAPGVRVTIQLVARDPDGTAVTLRVVSQPGHGTVGLSGAQAVYVPEAGFSGDDAFTFAAWDGSIDSNLATVRVTVR
jgi:hypothetical protein